MKEPMLTLVENAIRASLGPAADAIPRKDFKVAALSVLMALRTPTEGMEEAAYNCHDIDDRPNGYWEVMIDAAMQGA